MDKIDKVSPITNGVQHGWDYVKKIDDQVNAGTIGGTLEQSFKNSAKYKAQSHAIEHGTEAVITSAKWNPKILGDSLQGFDKFQGLAKTAAQNASAVNYETLAQHIKDGKAMSQFDWKGLLKGRAWSHVNHATQIADGTAASVGKAVATNVAKGFIVHHAYKDAKISFENAKEQGAHPVACYVEAGKTAAKEIGKAAASWEASSLGSAIAGVCMPGLGPVGMIAGGIVAGALTNYAAEKLAPSPVRIASKTPNKSNNNPFC